MSFALTLNFENPLNTSLQVGDQLYHALPVKKSDFNIVENNAAITHIGTVQDIIVNNVLSSFQVVVYSEHVCTAVGQPHVGCIAIGDPVPGIEPPNDSYIFFSKSGINNNDLLGYYASVNFINNSTTKAELFSVGSEITENSK